MITQLEQILDGVNLTFTLDSKFDINMQQVIQQLRIETEESKKTLNTIAKSATTVMEQVARFDVLQYQHEENIEE
jgi:ribosomal protein S17E